MLEWLVGEIERHVMGINDESLVSNFVELVCCAVGEYIFDCNKLYGFDIS